MQHFSGSLKGAPLSGRSEKTMSLPLLPDSHPPPDFIAAKAVLEGWQRAYRMATIPSGASESSRVEMAWRRLQEVSQPVCAAARQRLEEESDSSSRLGSIRLLHALWEELAAAAAPEGEQDAQQQGGWRKALAALGGSVMNAAVGACMYDAVGKVRLAATASSSRVAPHLPPEEVLKVALVKARER